MNNLPALIAATAVLVAIPGPNAALIVAQSLRRGVVHGLVTVAATTTGVGLQLIIVIAGLSVLLEVTAATLAWIKWIGAAYLVWVGIRTWRERVEDLDAVAAPKLGRTILEGVVLAVSNPKTLLFSAAFLPQFASTSGDVTHSLALLGGTYLTVILIGDLAWALAAAGTRRWLRRIAPWRNRLSGGFIAAAGVGLALAHHDD